MYLPLIGLCLVLAQFIPLLRIPKGAIGAMLSSILLMAGYATYVRNHAWASTIALWTDSATKSPRKARPNFQLAYAQYEAGNCGQALTGYEKVAKLEKPDYRLYADWALAADCAGRYDDALEKLKLGSSLEDTAHVHATMGMILAKQGKSDEALSELSKAEKLDPTFTIIPFYRGNVYMQRHEYDKAIQSYNDALRVDPNNMAVRRSLANAQQEKARPPSGVE
jgi:protein O-mannosyl-transferase